jgi:predicted transcriptional regulator
MNRSFLWKSLVVVFGCAIILTSGVVFLNAATVGGEVANVQIRDANDKPSVIPGIGTHVVGLFYGDADVADVGDPMADMIKAKKYGKDVYTGLGIANLKDSTAPNFIIRSVIQGKIKKYNSVILTDVDLTLPKVWGLGNCNDKSVFILIGKDRKVKYIAYKDKNNKWGAAEMNSVIQIIDDLLKK